MTGSNVLERAGAVRAGEEVGFTRSFVVDSTGAGPLLVAAEVADAVRSVAADRSVRIYNAPP